MPVFASELRTQDVQAMLAADAEIIVVWTCRTEVKSAIYRKARERVLTFASAEAAAVLP